MGDDQPVIQCRICGEPATGVYHMPGGCVCAPDPVQALCSQHVVTSEPIAGMWPIVEGRAPSPVKRLRGQLAERERQLTKARKALALLNHTPVCWLHRGGLCDCGVDALRRALAETEEKL